MAKHIAVAGKGGTGKTTFAALLIRYLLENERGTVLAVDADANANLNEALGLEVDHYISDILEETKDPKAVPSGMTKDLFVEYKLSQALVETKDVDLLVMGNPQGPGCYCYPNDLLRKHLQTLDANYEYVVLDNEAGLEHISRRLVQDLTHLFVISDASARGLRAAARVKQLVESVKIKVDNMPLVVTKADAAKLAALEPEITKTGLRLAGSIPLDPQVAEFDIEGKALFNLPAEAMAVRAVNDILRAAGV